MFSSISRTVRLFFSCKSCEKILASETRKRWQIPEKKKVRCSPSPAVAGDVWEACRARIASGLGMPSAVWIHAVDIFCDFRCFGQITWLEQSREETLGICGLLFVPGDLTVTAWEARVLAVCWDTSLHHRHLLAAHSHLSVVSLFWTCVQVGKEGANQKRSVSAFNEWLPRARCRLRASLTILLTL